MDTAGRERAVAGSFLEVVNDVKERAVDAGNAKKLAMADTKRAPLTKTTMHT